MQYSFIYQALLEYYLYGDTELDVCSLEGHLQRLHNTRAPHDRLGLEEEFRVGRKKCTLKHFSQQWIVPITLRPASVYFHGKLAQGATPGSSNINNNALNQLKLYKAPPSATQKLLWLGENLSFLLQRVPHSSLHTEWNYSPSPSSLLIRNVFCPASVFTCCICKHCLS